MDYFITKENTDYTKVFERLYDIFHQDALASISEDSSKLRTYSRIKTKLGIENYLTSHAKVNIQDRIALSKFRLSNHDLMNEKGRHVKINKNERFCPFCPSQIETEMHFLLNCKTFTDLRRDLLTKIIHKTPTFNFLSEEEKFIHLLNEEDTIKNVGTFLRKSFQCRTFLLEKHKNSD